MNGTLPKTRKPAASIQKPKHPQDSKRTQSTTTTKYGATTADVTTAKGEKSITT